MSETLNLGLPFIDGAQAQKHVTHNEALRILDTHIHAHALRRDLLEPPSNPQEGDAYVIADNATGVWLGHDNQYVVFQDGAWAYNTIKTGFVVWVISDDVLSIWDGTQWVDSAGGGVMPSQLDILGINATADLTNRLTVSSDAVLFNHAGSGIQQKLNKNSTSDTTSIVFQNAYSGRAEFGLTGDDDAQVKVSPDGSNWHSAIKINNSSGTVTMPQKPCVSLARNTDLSWGANTSEHVVYQTQEFIQGDISVNTGKSRVTMNQSGLYLIAPHVVVSSQVISSGDGWSLDVRKNGAKLNPGGSAVFAPNGFASSGSEMIATYSIVRPFSAGDYIEIFVTSIQSNAKCVGACLDVVHLG